MNTIERLLAAAQLAKNLELLESIVTQPQSGFVHHKDGSYWGNGLRVELGVALNLQEEFNALRSISELDLTIAPEIFEYIALPSKEAVLVTRWAGCDTKGLKGTKGQAIAESLVKAALEDMAALHASGMMHPYAAHGKANWFLSSDESRLYLSPWSPIETNRDIPPMSEIESVLRGR